MEENIQTGLSMLIIGMTTVFFILFLVVAGSNILIRFVNRYYPIDLEKEITASKTTDKGKIAAIVAAVDIATKGKGKIASIKKYGN